MMDTTEFIAANPGDPIDNHARAGEQVNADSSPPGDREQVEKDEILGRQMAQEFEVLRREFADVSPETVTAVGEAELGRLRSGARITEFIPVLVHRYAREDLLRLREEAVRKAA